MTRIIMFNQSTSTTISKINTTGNTTYDIAWAHAVHHNNIAKWIKQIPFSLQPCFNCTYCNIKKSAARLRLAAKPAVLCEYVKTNHTVGRILTECISLCPDRKIRSGVILITRGK